jgi:hypothetical protein
MRSRASVPPSRHLGLSDFTSRALVGAELARDAPATRAVEFPIDGRGQDLPLAPVVGVGAPTTVET